MRKILFVLLSLFLSVFALSTYAQKTYVSIYANLNDASSRWVSARVSGDKPAGVSDYYAATYDRLTEGDIINMLAEEGFVVERITGVGETHAMILMSKSSGNSDAGVVTYVNTDDAEVTEIARYNLQGIQVNENEKGVQIIVYSNYTTKTVVVQ